MRFQQRPGRPMLFTSADDLGLSPVLGTDGLSTASNRYGTLSPVASATPHTKGAYTELIASTTYDTGRLVLGGVLNLTTALGVAATDTSTLMDVAIGAAASEVVIVADIPVGYRSTTPWIDLPVFIPRGSRIAVRIQSVIVSRAITTMTWYTLPLDAKKPLPPRSLVTMGANTATSKGVTLTAPGALDTKGAWTEIVASTVQPFSGFNVAPQGDSGVAMSTTGVLVDIGAGPAASERVIIPDIPLFASAAVEFYAQYTPLSFRSIIPAGVRLAARYARDNAGNAVDLALIGVPQRW